jgi:hypothetical protein
LIVAGDLNHLPVCATAQDWIGFPMASLDTALSVLADYATAPGSKLLQSLLCRSIAARRRLLAGMDADHPAIPKLKNEIQLAEASHRYHKRQASVFVRHSKRARNGGI